MTATGSQTAIIPRTARRQDAKQQMTLIVNGTSCRAVGPLGGPTGSTRSVTLVLRKLKFRMVATVGTSLRAVRRHLRRFHKTVHRNDIKLFCFTNRNIRCHNRGCLVPISTPLRNISSLRFCTLPLGTILSQVRSTGDTAGVIVLSTYHGGPFPKKSHHFRKKLTAIRTSHKFCVTCTAHPNRITSSNAKHGNACARTLLHRVNAPGVSVRRVFGRIHDRMSRTAKNQRLP